MSDLAGRNIPSRDSMPKVLLEGAFSCQYCDEVVNEGTYLTTVQVLMWECSNGHKSIIEGFKL